MGALASDGQTGSRQMSHSALQHIGFHRVIHRQLHPDFIDGHIAHNAGSGNVQRLQISGYPFRLIECPLRPGKGIVVRPGFGKDLIIIRFRHMGCDLVIGGNGLGLVLGVDILTDDRI